MLLFASCKRTYISTTGFKTEELTDVKFYKTGANYGAINEGDTVSSTYKFKNSGSNDLVITKIEVSCGCTFPDYPKKPVKPGQEDSLIVRFASNGKLDRQVGRLVFYMNTKPEDHEIILEGIVKPKKNIK